MGGQASKYYAGHTSIILGVEPSTPIEKVQQRQCAPVVPTPGCGDRGLLVLAD